MIIIHKISELLFELFPKAMGKKEDLKQIIEDFYAYGPYRPKVTIEDEFITVEIDTAGIINQEADYRKAIALCEKRKFGEAKPILVELIKRNPSVSEYHRILGQILSDEGNQEDAIDYLIDALRWNPKNGYALLMMGNIFAREKDDLETAKKYYDAAIELNPDDHIAINNLGTNLLQLDKWDKGLEYLEKAYKLNPNYPNTSYGIAMAKNHFGEQLTAFDFVIDAIKHCGPNDTNLLNHCLGLTLKVAEEWTKTNIGENTFKKYKTELEERGGKIINVEQQPELPTTAKIEFAEIHRREFHLIKYKPDKPAVAHLMMHELVHLDFVLEARRINHNKLFVSDGEKKRQFIKDHERETKVMLMKGYPETTLTLFMNRLFDGLNTQIYNAPIDLFIEDYLYLKFPELRPYQFLSLLGLLNESIASVTHKEVIEITPKNIIYANKILNVVFALHFKELFGYNLIAKFNATPLELKEANRLFTEYKEYQKDREPGEEYELVQHWGEDFKFSKYFELIDEEMLNRRRDTDKLLENIENDPFGEETDGDFKKKEQDKFQKSQARSGTNMAVVMYMVDALQYFKEIPKDKIKKVALEIAMLGTQGISPGSDKKYKLAHIPGKEFTGFHLLAYYYVSFVLAIPEMVQQLNLPYHDEYKTALEMIKG